MSDWYKQYVSILEADVEYNRLSDAGEYYRPGDTEIWYLKSRFHPDSIDVNNLYRTHAMIGTLAETDPETIFSMMQSENWNTDNAAESMLDDLGVEHSSMRRGDVIVIDNTAHVISDKGIIAVELAN
jgi:hypothetical protein